jgi:hypothetical protein
MDWRIFSSWLGFVLRNSKATSKTLVPLTKNNKNILFHIKKNKGWLATPVRG